jgi:hypothetical protein
LLAHSPRLPTACACLSGGVIQQETKPQVKGWVTHGFFKRHVEKFFCPGSMDFVTLYQTMVGTIEIWVLVTNVQTPGFLPNQAP